MSISSLCGGLLINKYINKQINSMSCLIYPQQHTWHHPRQHPGQVQLGPRYEGQLNPMAEPIPHEVRPLVRTHVYHLYHAADRQAETDS